MLQVRVISILVYRKLKDVENHFLKTESNSLLGWKQSWFNHFKTLLHLHLTRLSTSRLRVSESEAVAKASQSTKTGLEMEIITCLLNSFPFSGLYQAIDIKYSAKFWKIGNKPLSLYFFQIRRGIINCVSVLWTPRILAVRSVIYWRPPVFSPVFMAWKVNVLTLLETAMVGATWGCPSEQMPLEIGDTHP